MIDCSPKKQAQVALADVVCPNEGFFATDFKYSFFGKIGYREREFQEDTLVYPPIEGMVHKSAFVMCPADTCVAEYAVLALRCPPIEPLLNWVSDTVNTFVHECPIGNGLLTYNEKQLDIPVKHLKSDKAICDYYIGQLQHAYDDWQCTGEGDHDNINEQAGLLLADCWHTGNLYTFYRIDWYDWMSAGNNARESWWTVDATSGKLLDLSDFILPDKLDTLAALMMPRLINGKNSFMLDQYPYKPEEYTGVLQRANGCALIPEGMVFYFYPYNLGSGADGQYEAVIPYEELEGILKEPLSMVLHQSTEEISYNIREDYRKGQKPCIDLFGVDLVGSPKHILQSLNHNDYIQLDLGPNGLLEVLEDRFWCRVYVGDIPFAMNVFYEKDSDDQRVSNVLFSTRNNERYIIKDLVKTLTAYYGAPEIIDIPDEYYKWFPRGHFMQARPLHHEDGGWTFYITE